MTNQYQNQSRRNILKYLAGAVAFPELLMAQGIKNSGANYKSKQKTRDEIRKDNYAEFSRDTDEVLLARMLFGEARGGSNLEKVAIAYTAINRANDGKTQNGRTLREAILEPYQYSCFNKEDSNRKKLINPEKYELKSFEECLSVSKAVLSGKYQDPTQGATHYFNPSKVKKPKWAYKYKKIGRINTPKGPSKHEFYKEN